ncbi:hypothetical protein [Streptomyces sp. NPDC047070]|uniref:hypothetical protein n=1 Tax=Streptomyces sp. NPDC047070 TaxID=3154923 RepID=UPI0034561781
MPEHTLDETLPVHPRTGLRAVYRSPKTGRLFWPIMGGSGEGDGAAGSAGGNGTDPNAGGNGTPPATPPAGGDPNAGNAGTPPAGTEQTAQQLADATARADEATAERDQLRAALDAVNKALNPDSAEAEQDPAKLAAAVADRDKQLGDLSSQLRTAQVELAAYKAAGKEGARADRLLNSRSFVDAVAKLDPAGDKFDEQLLAAIKTAVDADPDLYRATPAAPPRGGGEFNGAPAGDRKPASLHDAIAARMGG